MAPKYSLGEHQPPACSMPTTTSRAPGAKRTDDSPGTSPGSAVGLPRTTACVTRTLGPASPLIGLWQFLLGTAVGAATIRGYRLRPIWAGAGIAALMAGWWFVVFVAPQTTAFVTTGPVSAGVCALVIAAVAGGVPGLTPLLGRPALVRLGKASYALYILHWPALLLLMAAGADLPVFPVSDLRALAAQAQAARTTAAGRPGELLLACMDARMGEIYWGAFEAGPRLAAAPGCNEAVGAPDSLPVTLRGRVGGAAGRGLHAYPQIALSLGIGSPDCLPEAEPDAADIARLAGLYQSGQLQLDEMITKRYRLDDINQAYADLLNGEIIRGIIDFGIS